MCSLPYCGSVAYFNCGWNGFKKLKIDVECCSFVVEAWNGCKLIIKSNWERMVDSLPNFLDKIKKELKGIGGDMKD